MHKAKVGQVWQDKDTRGCESEPATFEVTQTDGSHGGFAEGIRRPSGRKTRIRLDVHGGVSGYRLVDGDAAPADAAVEYTRSDALEGIKSLRGFLSGLGRRGMSAAEYGPYLNELFMLESWVSDQSQERTPAESSSP